MKEQAKSKTCRDCKHVLHGAGFCDKCNCGESELILSKRWQGMPKWWLPLAPTNKELLAANRNA